MSLANTEWVWTTMKNWCQQYYSRLLASFPMTWLHLSKMYMQFPFWLFGDRYGSARWSGSCLSIAVSPFTTYSTSRIILTSVTGDERVQRTHFFDMLAAINRMQRILVQLPTSTGAPSVHPACNGSPTGRILRQSNALNLHTPYP